MVVPVDFPLDLTIVIPVYKNAETLESLYLRLCDVLNKEGLRFEILFVDDACPQQSLLILKRLVEKDSRVTVLVMEQNIGQQRSVLAGLSVAEGLVVVIMDADLQDPPEALPVLFEKLAEGYDVVFGGRAGKYEAKHRLFTSRLYKWILHLLTGIPIDAGMFLVAKHALVKRLLDMPVPITHLVAMIGVTRARVVSIPVERPPRTFGVSTYTGWMRLRLGVQAAAWVLAWKLGFPFAKKLNALPSSFPIREKLGRKVQVQSPGDKNGQAKGFEKA